MHVFFMECRVEGRKCFPLHVPGDSSGSANQVIHKRFFQLSQVLSDAKRSALFVAGYPTFHDEQLTFWNKCFERKDFRPQFDQFSIIARGPCHFSHRFIHLVKAIRSRLLKYALAIICGKFEPSGVWSVSDQDFSFRAAFTDKSGGEKMRDIHSIALVGSIMLLNCSRRIHSPSVLSFCLGASWVFVSHFRR
jgi:hypothetical protein